MSEPVTEWALDNQLDKVSVHICHSSCMTLRAENPSGGCAYLTASEARKVAAALLNLADTLEGWRDDT